MMLFPIALFASDSVIQSEQRYRWRSEPRRVALHPLAFLGGTSPPLADRRA